MKDTSGLSATAQLREAVETIRRLGGLTPLVDPSFGNTLRQKRKERGISLRRLAALASVSPSLVSKVENGHAPPPGEEAIRRFARALDVDEFEFLRLAGKLPRELVEAFLKKPVEEWRRLL